MNYRFLVLFIVLIKSSKNVFPAKAGIYLCNKLGASVYTLKLIRKGYKWIPAFAGKTKSETMNKARFFIAKQWPILSYRCPPMNANTIEAQGKRILIFSLTLSQSARAAPVRERSRKLILDLPLRDRSLMVAARIMRLKFGHKTRLPCIEAVI